MSDLLSAKHLLSEHDKKILKQLREVDGFGRVVDDHASVCLQMRGDTDSSPFLTRAINIDLNPADPAGPEDQIRNIEGHQRCIILNNVLQHFGEYRKLIAAAFDKLAVGGFMLIVVPHQFLSEKKLNLPSRVNPGHKKFYTPSLLMTEVEEAIDPLQYRVRMLADNDFSYEYSAGIAAKPEGGTDIVLCLQRLDPPPWAHELESLDRPVSSPVRPSRYPAAGQRSETKNLIIAPDEQRIRSILLMKLDHRGDFQMADEAFQLMRSAFPRAKITLVCGEWNQDLAVASGLFDEILPFNFFPEDAGSVTAWTSFEKNVEMFKSIVGDVSYDLAVDLRFYEDTRELLRYVNTRNRAGIDPYQSFRWLSIPLSLPVPTRDGRAQSRFVDASSFSSSIGSHRGFEIGFEDEPRCHMRQVLTWGPYIDLGPGDFNFEILVEPIGGASRLIFDISSHSGTKIEALGYLDLIPGRFPQIRVEARGALRQFELRLYAPNDGPLPRFRFKGLRYTRGGVVLGVHQQEAMALLVTLVQLRLRNPFVVMVDR